MVKQMRIDIGHDGRELPGFYDVFAGDVGGNGHTGDDNFLTYFQQKCGENCPIYCSAGTHSLVEVCLKGGQDGLS